MSESESEREKEREPEHLAVPLMPMETDFDPQLRVMHALAVLGVVFGTIGVVSLPFGLIRFHQGAIPGDYRVNLFSLAGQSPSPQSIWLFFSSLLGTGLAGMLLVGSAGAITFRHWARPVLLMWAIGSLIVSGCGSLFYFRWLLPPWREQWAQVRGVVDMLVNYGGWGIGTALAIAMLVFLMRPVVQAAFRRQSG